MIRNVILDMGNVLLNFDPEIALGTYCSCEESRQLIRLELFKGKEWSLGDLGLITNEQRYDLVKQRIPEKWHGELKNCVEHWDICMTRLPGVWEFLQKLRSDGYGIYVLSNACNRFYSYFPQQLPMEFFDGIVVSSDLHAVKPDRRMYDYLLETYHLDPDSCFFADDTSINAAGCEVTGMHGYIFRGDYDALYSAIKELDQNS